MLAIAVPLAGVIKAWIDYPSGLPSGWQFSWVSLLKVAWREWPVGAT